MQNISTNFLGAPGLLETLAVVSVSSASRERMHLLTLSFEIGVQLSSVADIAVYCCAVFATSVGTLELCGEDRRICFDARRKESRDRRQKQRHKCVCAEAA